MPSAGWQPVPTAVAADVISTMASRSSSVDDYNHPTREKAAEGLDDIAVGTGLAAVAVAPIPVVGEGLSAVLGTVSEGASVAAEAASDSPERRKDVAFGGIIKGAKLLAKGLETTKAVIDTVEKGKTIMDAAKKIPITQHDADKIPEKN